MKTRVLKIKIFKINEKFLEKKNQKNHEEKDKIYEN